MTHLTHMPHSNSCSHYDLQNLTWLSDFFDFFIWIFIPGIWSILYGNFCHQLKSQKSFLFQHQLQFSFCIHNMWPKLHWITFIIRSSRTSNKLWLINYESSNPYLSSVTNRYLLLITIIANIITIVLVNFFWIHLDRTLKFILILVQRTS